MVFPTTIKRFIHVTVKCKRPPTIKCLTPNNSIVTRIALRIVYVYIFTPTIKYLTPNNSIVTRIAPRIVYAYIFTPTIKYLTPNNSIQGIVYCLCRRVYTEPSGRLVLTETRQTDEGSYSCHAENLVGRRSSVSAILAVMGESWVRAYAVQVGA